MQEDMRMSVYKSWHHEFAPEIDVALGQNCREGVPSIARADICDEPGRGVYRHGYIADESLLLGIEKRG